MQKIEKGYVSLIVPCFNVEKYIERFLNSVLAQTYDKIELILVDDGSTDKTKAIIESMEGTLQKKVRLKYVYQGNQGLGAAINTGLKYFKGEYLCWADPDDILEAESIEKRVAFLEKHVEFGCVTSDANMYKENDLQNPVGQVSENARNNTASEQFIYLLKAQSIFCSGCHMIRSTAFLSVNEKREIYPARRGQNWQLLLPVYHEYKRGFLSEPLYKYIIYEKSMSYVEDSKMEYVKRYDENKEIVFRTLDMMKISNKEKKKYKKVFQKLYSRDIYYVAIKYDDFKLAMKSIPYLIGSEYMHKFIFLDFLSLIKRKLLGRL